MKNLNKGAQEQAAAAAQQGQATGPVPRATGDFEIRATLVGGKPVAQQPTPAQRNRGGTFKTSGGNQHVKKVSPSTTARSGVQITSNPDRTTVVRSQPRPNPMVPQQGYGSGQRTTMQPRVVPQELVQPQQYEPSHVPTEPVQQQSGVRREDVTVILTIFERPGQLKRQLQALFNQTVQPAHMIMWANAGEVAQDARVMSSLQGTVIRSNTNHGAWPRYREGLFAPTTYVCFLDDDTIPGPRWLESALERIKVAEADPEGGTLCVAAAGEIFRSDNPDDRMVLGPQMPRDEEMEVDIGRQGWVLRRDLLPAVVANPFFGDGRMGWDIHLAAALQTQDVLTIVLPYEQGNTENWGMLEPPVTDRSVTWRMQLEAGRGGKDAIFRRRELYTAYRQVGWTPLCAFEAGDEDESEAGVG